MGTHGLCFSLIYLLNTIYSYFFRRVYRNVEKSYVFVGSKAKSSEPFTAKHGWSIVKVPGDGNCLFACFYEAISRVKARALQQSATAFNPRQLRQQIFPVQSLTDTKSDRLLCVEYMRLKISEAASRLSEADFQIAIELPFVDSKDALHQVVKSEWNSVVGSNVSFRDW